MTLFPVPLRPMMQQAVPRGTSKDTLSRTRLSSNDFVTLLKRIACSLELTTHQPETTER